MGMKRLRKSKEEAIAESNKLREEWFQLHTQDEYASLPWEEYWKVRAEWCRPYWEWEEQAERETKKEQRYLNGPLVPLAKAISKFLDRFF
jgi:hypothetical protein